ncbi:MAG: tryptophan--tRNA ligase [Parcubacteria group bacterium]|jgi:tryptophanyl-tRNA synthetase
MTKKRIFSGIQPSGNLHIGNYLGAIKNWVDMQDEYESIFCVVDMHAITVPQDPEILKKKTIEIAKIYLAAGIDPEKSTIFIQSHVKAHAELCWILNTITQNGDLTKMTQFKDKTGMDVEAIVPFIKEQSERKLEEIVVGNSTNDLTKQQVYKITAQTAADVFQKFIKERFNSAGMGLFDYPVLMAGDILLYDTQTVPVGQDQVQHVELARTLARRFNKRFGETFVVPEYFVKEEGKMIMGLDNPEKKMSKSAASEYNYISLMDDAESVRKKIRKAVTDSGEEIVYRDEKPALKNLINIYAILAGMTAQGVEQKFVGKRYGDFKNNLAEVIVNFLTPFQERMQAISDEDALQVLHDGARRAEKIAEKKIREVKEKVGFII